MCVLNVGASSLVPVLKIKIKVEKKKREEEDDDKGQKRERGGCIIDIDLMYCMYPLGTHTHIEGREAASWAVSHFLSSAVPPISPLCLSASQLARFPSSSSSSSSFGRFTQLRSISGGLFLFFFFLYFSFSDTHPIVLDAHAIRSCLGSKIEIYQSLLRVCCLFFFFFLLLLFMLLLVCKGVGQEKGMLQ